MVYTPYLGNPPLPQPPKDKDGLVRWAADLTTVLYRWITNLAKRSDVKIKTGLESERPPARGERTLWYSIDTGKMDIDPNWEGSGSGWSEVVPGFNLDDRYVNTTGDTMTGVLNMDLGAGASIQMGPTYLDRPLGIAVGSGVNALFQADQTDGETGLEFYNTRPDLPNPPEYFLAGMIRSYGEDWVSPGGAQYEPLTFLVQSYESHLHLSAESPGYIRFFTNDLERGRIENNGDWYIGNGDTYTVQSNDNLSIFNLDAAILNLSDGSTGTGSLTKFLPAHTQAGDTDIPDTLRLLGDGAGLVFDAPDATGQQQWWTNGSLRMLLTEAGDLYIGDGGTSDYASFDASGHFVLNGAATVWDDLRVEPIARTTGTGAPAFEKWYDDNLNSSRGVFLYSFTDESVLTNEKEVFFTMQLPHAWNGVGFEFHVHWVPAVSKNTSTPRWGLEYCWKNIGQVFGDTVLIYATGNTAGDANLTANKHYITDFAIAGPDNTQDGMSSILIGRVFRSSSDAADTYTGDKVGLLYIDAHYEINTLGSNQEYIK